MTSIASDPRGDVSLSVNYLPAKYTALHEPGQYAHRRGSFFSRTSLADEVSVDDKDPSPSSAGRVEDQAARSDSPARARLSRFFPASMQLAHKTIPRGGGREAFASDAGRMGGEEEEGDEVLAHHGTGGIQAGEGLRQRRVPGQTRFEEGLVQAPERGERKKPSARLVWNRFKWCIFFANLLVSVGVGSNLFAPLTTSISCSAPRIRYWNPHNRPAGLVRRLLPSRRHPRRQPHRTHQYVLTPFLLPSLTPRVVSTAAGALCLFTSLLGFAGIILNNRAFLAVYNLLLWACFALIVTPGYLTYKQHTFNLEGKINAQWSRVLGLSGRLRIQNQVSCAGLSGEG